MRVKKKERNFSNTVLLVLGLGLLAFIVCMVVTFWKFQAVPDTLIQYTLGAGGLEAVALAGIKIGKVIKGKEDVVNE